jgi:WD40 repeat protein
MHPSGEAMVLGLPERPVRWARGQPLKLPGRVDPKQPRPRLAYSPDGNYLAFAPPGGRLELWDEQATRVLATCAPQGAADVLAVGFGSPQKTLWACRADGQVLAWSLPDFKSTARWQIPGAPDAQGEAQRPGEFTAAAFNADATHLAVGDARGDVLLLGPNGKRLCVLRQPRAGIHALAWSPDSKLVAVGTTSGDVHLWDRHAGILTHRFAVFMAEVDSVLFSPDGRWLLGGSRTGPTRMWDVATGEQVLTGPSVAWGFSRDGKRLATAGRSEAAFCELLLPAAVRQLTGHQSGVAQLAWSRDHQHLASLDSRSEVRVWRATAAAAVRSLHPPPGGFYAHQSAIALSDDAGQVAYVSGGQNSVALFYDVATGRKLASWPLPEGFEMLSCAGGARFLSVREEPENAGQVVYHSVARELTADQPPRLLRVVRPSQPGDRRKFQHHELTPDGRFYIWTGPREPLTERRVEVYEVATGRLVTRLRAPGRDGVEDNAGGLSSDGRFLRLELDGGPGLIYDLSGAAPPVRSRTRSLSHSPDCQWYVLHHTFDAVNPFALGRNSEQAWLRLVWKDVKAVTVHQFSRDSRYLAWGMENGTVVVIDLPALARQVRDFEASLGVK